MQALRMAAAAVEGNGGEVLAVLALAVLILAVLCVWLVGRVQGLSRSYARLTAGTEGGSLETVLNEHLARVVSVLQRADQVESQCQDLDRRVRRCVQHVGVVRFDAFDDVGGKLSFALAALDDTGNGYVISSVHSRQETRLYTKPVRDGKCEVALTAEEAEALHQAGFETDQTRLVRIPDMGSMPRR